jgi:DNA repair exonuclease SbcCD ATPase subunit
MIQDLRNKFERRKGRRDQIEITVSNLTERLSETKQDLRRHDEAREILRTVGLETQRQLQYHISDITSLALEAVFDDPYELVAEFVERRNKTECDLYFSRRESRVDPLDASGGGAVDVASFALRIAAWSMTHPRRRNVIILDEPMKFLDTSTDRIMKASQMLKEISTRLGLQFIIVTHEDTLTEYADRVFRVRQSKNGVSHVKQIK